MGTLRQTIGQSLIIGIEGTSLNADERKFIANNNIGGIILFARNLATPKELHNLTTEIQGLRHQMPDKAPLFVSIDMEGGRVHRLKPPFTQWPPLRSLGDLDSPSLAFKFAETMGKELSSIGINLDFAPCVDVQTNPKNEIIGDRSLGIEPEIVAKMASALVRGYIKGGVIPCAKHFPGHGNTLLDSHEELPVEEMGLDRLNEIELIPFKRAFRARLDLVMTAHIKFPKIDPDWPVTLSEKFLGEILRNDIGFRNLIITDDLDMKALRNHYSIEEIATQAVKAGANILLYCNESDSPPKALDAVEKAVRDGEIAQETLENSASKVLKLKRMRLPDPEPQSFEEVSRIIGHPSHLNLVKAILSGEVPEDVAT